MKKIYLVRVYRDGVLLPDVWPFRSEAGANAFIKKMVPGYCRAEVISAELND